MFQQGRRPSDSESETSETSDVTSRATTLPDSWSNAALSQQQQQLKSLDIQQIEDDRSLTPTPTASVNTVISNKAVGQKANNTPSNQVNTQQQQPWVNPYWGANWKPNTSIVQSGTNNPNIQK